MNEWEFTALAAQWITGAIENNRDSPFREARCEQTSRGSRQRRDLTLVGKDGKKLVSGEVKMPYQAEGGSPLRSGVVRDARAKAQRAKVNYFFTWNVNRLALFPTDIGPDDPPNAAYREWQFIDIHRAPQIQLAENQDRIRKELARFLHELAEVLRGDRLIDRKPPDLRFIDAIEAELEQPILNTADALAEKSRRAGFRAELNRWMVEDQGWTVADPADRQGVLADLNRAAQFANYALLNKLVFYEALIKRYGDALDRLDVPDHINEADRLRTHFEGHFARAREVTRDYETVFGDDPGNVGHRIPFHCDPAVDYWRQLVGEIHEFDFSRLDYEVIGAIFERLISPEERHKFGQYYTRAEVVDLINAFCIRKGSDKVMDPACGGGTFLVRAYSRKKELDPARSHRDLLQDLYGTDISHFATHLTTINLATRDLIDDENYPQIARTDFFDVDPGSVIMQVPRRIVTGGLGTGQTRQVDIPVLDAIVGNPPYVRQEDIPKAPQRKGKPTKDDGPPPGTKDFYKLVAERGYGTDLSGRSDLHVYFWLHAAEFLHHGGRLGLLTSSQWLDVEYGFRLQEFILRHFQIEAVFESLDEPWFVGARVATVATLLRRIPVKHEAQRMNHPVRFVQLRRPIAEVLEHDGTGAGAVAAADRFRDHILSLESDTLTDRYRCRVVCQGELWNDGVKLGQLLGKSKRGPAPGKPDPDRQLGEYYGGKWGMHLRAPDVWFELIDRFGDRFTPLGDIAEVKFGVKSGKDAFFFPIDASAEALKQEPDPDAFRTAFGAPRDDVESGAVKIVKCGDKRGEMRPIESELLEPEIHSLMTVDRFIVDESDAKHQIVLTGMKTVDLPEYAKRYVEWAEEEGWHESPTCAARVTDSRDWHDLTYADRADIILPKIAQYRIMSFQNPDRLYQASALLGLYNVEAKDRNALAGLINSTIGITSFLLFARGLGNEANLQLDVYLAQMMLIPDIRLSQAADRKRVADAFVELRGRKALGFVSERRLRRDAYTRKGKEAQLEQLDDRTELDLPDRWRLDDAVLRMIGVADKAERQALLDKLYGHLRQHFEWTRQKEEKAVVNKKRAKKKGPAGPAAIAAEVVEQLKREQPALLRSWARDFLARGEAFVTYEVPAEGQPEVIDDLIHPDTVRFTRGGRRVGDVATDRPEHAALVATLADAGVRGFVRVPLDAARAAQLHEKFRAWWEQRTAALSELVSQRTRDRELAERTLASIGPMLPAA
jgi:hypothetical protein